MQFSLTDIPENCEVRLSDELVDSFDKLNRPWLYDGSKKRGRKTKVWAARDKIFKRLWGYSRFGRKPGIDNGAFLKLEQVYEDILKKTNVPFWLVEEGIIGIRSGTMGRELRCKLPIKPNKWWAKLLGFFWSSGSYYLGHRDRGFNEYHFRFAVDDAVLPMLSEIAKHIGDTMHKVTYIPVFKGPHKAKTLRSRIRQPVVFSNAALHVLIKFGELPEDPPQSKRKTGRHQTIRSVKPSIPEWVSNNDEFMHTFIEGFINGQRGHSIMHKGDRGITTQVYLRISGEEKHADDVKKFAETIKKWFNKHGITGYFRKMPKCHQSCNHYRYEFMLHNFKSLTFLWKNFEILRPDMRARLFLRQEYQKDYALRRAIQTLSSQEVVILGILLEKPRSLEELKQHVRMRPEYVEQLVRNLEVIKLKNGRYVSNILPLLNRLREENHTQIKRITEKMHKWAGKLIYQCTNCGEIYDEPKICEICGLKVEPVSREVILGTLGRRRGKANHALRKLNAAMTKHKKN